MKLTINVATLPDRDQSFVIRLKEIAPLWCEINVDESIGNLGDKRQMMLLRSHGDYVCVIDDDDDINDDYFDQILIGINKNVDVICLPVRRFKDGTFHKDYHFGKFNPNTTQDTIGHFCPIKKELAIQSGYRSIGRGEDFDFSIGLIDKLKTAHYISKPLYFQKFISREKEYDLYDNVIEFQPRVTSGKLPLV